MELGILLQNIQSRNVDYVLNKNYIQMYCQFAFACKIVRLILVVDPVSRGLV